jgi:mono/diheme cytochrome c family protein
MNNELKYIVRGCLLVMVFLIAVLLLNFSFFHKEPGTNSSPIVIIDNDSAINSTFSEGRALFMTNCASCHAINKRLTGPALAGIRDRVPDKQLLYEWIRNNKKVLKSGNPYFSSLYKEYGQTQMNLFPNLTDKDIDAILAYASNDDARQSLPSTAVIVISHN